MTKRDRTAEHQPQRRRRRLRTVASAAALAGVTALAGCGASTSAAPSAHPAAGRGSLQPFTIALDWTANVDYLGIYVAEAKGYFAAEGIKPVILPYSGPPAETLLRAGKADLGLTYPPNIPAYRASGLDYEAVAGLTQENTIDIAVLASSKYTRVSQLSGTLYGGFGVSSDQPIIEDVMRQAGVAHPVYREITLNTDAYTALAAGRVAYSITYGGIDDVTARLEGIKLREFPIKDYLGAAFSFPDDAFVAMDKAVAADPSLYRRALAALSKGYTWSAEHPAQAEAILIQDNRTALAHSQNIIQATGNATAPILLTRAGRWGLLDNADFAGLTKIEVQGGLMKASQAPAPSSDYTDRLLP